MIPPIVSAAWLVDAAPHDDLVIADVRWYLDGRSGLAAFEAGHLPGAIFVDLERDLTVHDLPATAGRHPLPTPEHFAAAMGRHGIGDATTVVAYDDSGGGSAARLVVMLRMLGRSAALLDGGLRAWAGPLESGPTGERAHTSFTVRPWSVARLIEADEVARLALAPEAGVVLDARAPERYRGDTEPIDPRAGHVPGARNAPWAANLDPDTSRFLSPADLRSRYTALGVGTGETVCYCGSGVSACVDVLAVEHAGLGVPRLFVASWSGWSNDPDRPVATG
jgi:thiosulfate/3-mercaptopyruvate sulfurtransferase